MAAAPPLDCGRPGGRLAGPGRLRGPGAAPSPPTVTARLSACHRRCAPHTHTRTRSHTRTAARPRLRKGTQGVWPLGAQPRLWPLTGRWDPHREGQEPPRHRPLALSQQRGPEGQAAGAAWWPLAPSPRARRGSYDLETDLELSRGTRGPFSQPGLQWPSCLQCHKCIVSFINFKYKQNKNHIFLRQQQFSR